MGLFGKKKVQTTVESVSFKCPVCGLDCLNKESLDRHVEWQHKDQKPPVKS
jgi:hypothetical protein